MRAFTWIGNNTTYDAHDITDDLLKDCWRLRQANLQVAVSVMAKWVFDCGEATKFLIQRNPKVSSFRSIVEKYFAVDILLGIYTGFVVVQL